MQSVKGRSSQRCYPGRNDAQPLQGRNLTTREAGIRVPVIVWGPGVGVSSGKTESTVVSALDWFLTLATLAGIEVPRDSAIDGRDILRKLRGIVVMFQEEMSRDARPAGRDGGL